MNLLLWLRRFFWCTAWILWACFGWALYLVLPRTVDPPVAVLGLSQQEWTYGFLEGEPTVVSFDWSSSTINVWNATAGRLVTSFPANWDQTRGQAPPLSRVYARVLVCNNSKADGEAYVEVLDLRSGERKPIVAMGDRLDMEVQFHDVRPWVVGPDVSRGGMAKEAEGRFAPRVSVYDVTTQKPICTLPPIQSPSTIENYYFMPWFVPGADKLIVHHYIRAADGASGRFQMEIWSIPFASKPDHILPDVVMESRPSFSGTGLVAWKETPEGAVSEVDVLDLNTGRLVLSDPPRDQRVEARMGMKTVHEAVFFSPDSRRISDGKRRWDLDTGVATILPKSATEGVSFHLRSGLSETKRRWESFPVVRWIVDRLGGGDLATRVLGPIYIVRDLQTDRFLYSCSGPSIPQFQKGEWNLNLDNGTVRQLPPRVRWEVIATIEAALALVLMLTPRLFQRRRRLGASTPPPVA